MLVASHVVVVKVDQSLDGLLHGRHLNQRHLPVPGREAGDYFGAEGTCGTCRGRLYLLEKLKGLHGPSRVGEEQPQVILRHVLPGKEITLKVKDNRRCPTKRRGGGVSASAHTGCWTGGVWRMEERCSGSSWSQAS